MSEYGVNKIQSIDSYPSTRRDESESQYAWGILDMASDGQPSDTTIVPKNTRSSILQFYPRCCYKCCNQEQSQSDIGISLQNRCRQDAKYLCSCPPTGIPATFLTTITLFVILWVTLFLLLKETSSHDSKVPSLAGPKGPVSALVIILLSGLFLGIGSKFIGLPALLGPLVLGIIIQNIDAINVFKWLEGDCHWISCSENATNATNECCGATAASARNNVSYWIKPIRHFALTLILTRAGVELSPKHLRKMKLTVPLLAFGPCLAEAITCTTFTYIFFNFVKGSGYGITLPMCFVTGFALAAVSPAVVVPGLLSLKRKGFGEAQGISTLLIAASSIDDVLAISAYSVALSIAVHNPGSEKTSPEYPDWLVYIQGLLGIIVGIFHGLVIGCILHFIPSRNTNYLGRIRLALLLATNFASVLVYDMWEVVTSAGSLSVLVTSFVSSFGWRSQPHWKRPMKTVQRSLSILWTLWVPLVFGTIGKEIDFSTTDLGRLGKIIAIIFISLIIRCMTTFFIVHTVKLTWKERLFCALSWIPKATVQATLAPLVLSRIEDMNGDKDFLTHGRIVVETAVYAILITAPLGSVLISFLGPKLLQSSRRAEPMDQEFPGGDDDNIAEAAKVTSSDQSIKSITRNMLFTHESQSDLDLAIGPNSEIAPKGSR